MNKKSIYLIAISLFTVFSIVFGTYWHTFHKKEAVESSHHVFEVEAKDIKNISIETSTRNVEIRENSDDKKFKIEYYGNKPNIVGGTDTLQVYETKKKSNSFKKSDWTDNTITIFVPVDRDIFLSANAKMGDVRVFAGNWTDMNIATSMGDLTINGVKAKSLAASDNMGDINLQDINVENINTNSSAGDLNINNVDTKELNVETDAGDVSIKNSSPKKLNIKVNAGDVSVMGSNGDKIKVRTKMGDISVSSSDFKKKDIESKAGDVSY